MIGCTFNIVELWVWVRSHQELTPCKVMRSEYAPSLVARLSDNHLLKCTSGFLLIQQSFFLGTIHGHLLSDACQTFGTTLEKVSFGL